MGSIFRSEEMTLCQLFLHSDSAYSCIAELGELGLVQFRDTVPTVNIFQRKFVNEVRRCDEMERKLIYLENEIKKDNIPLLDLGENPEAPAAREMIDLEANFEKLETELKDINSNADALKRNYLELQELRHLLRKAQIFFDEDSSSLTGGGHRRLSESLAEQHDIRIPLDNARSNAENRDQRIQFISGVMTRRYIPGFELMLWRACRGNVFLKQAEIDTTLKDPLTGDELRKNVFIVFFQGEQLKSRIQKISEAFHATLYPCPTTPSERTEMLVGVETRIEDLKTVLSTTQEHRQRALVNVAKQLQEWFIKVRKIKAIYHILNLFNLDVTSRAVIGECWCAVDDLSDIQTALQRGVDRSHGSVAPIVNRIPLSPGESPPTFNRVNKFTQGFQGIVDAFGIAAYREVNPAPFTVMTFPFFFAVMFGDCGHGFLLTLFALWMVLKERSLGAKKSNNEIWNTFFGGRYIILLMGLFSIYTGLIYNDAFSKSLNIFGSGWEADVNLNLVNEHQAILLAPGNRTKGVYVFGVDPIWQVAKNKITYTNSLKMKMSIILGVMHMLFGVTLSLKNHLFFKDYLSVFCEFIPQVIFMSAMFGYLIVLIFVKWITVTYKDPMPSLLLTLINLFMKPGTTSLGTSADGTEKSNKLYDGQETVQLVLLAVIIICVPWMLVIKPFVLWRRNKEHSARYARMDHDSSDLMEADANDDHGGHGEHGEHFEMGEIIVHQTIHTIDYCLGCISNTASYLRLWALSLAHGQLSEVLWTMVFRVGLQEPSFVGVLYLFVTFAAWACLTVGILLLMEGLSAFLHALRLHWVEFQNKFYKGTGYKFEPFFFKNFTDAVAE